MTYQVLHNLDSRFGRCYQRGDRLAEGYVGSLPEDRIFDSAEDICEFIFQRHNRDDRPDGKTAPSLSVGDVITFSELDTTFTVARFGWERVDRESVDADRLGVPWKDTR